ncbi:TetR/AcrR family transcriptional regulator [Dactylosporangium siamense]|uniref:TetR family transcriptional regulator n=2 Tax=Dactylosporangium siamense TaxID=685454 RepID=A0A919PR83_9ACTN|nr:TetR family transcriptional regulator [Dactylosporangium siamense]
MSPDQRRAMIVAAALPLVVEHGASVTTAQVARAAGIGEGTVFRAFADKDALLLACMAEALRADDTLAHVRAIDLDQPLADRLVEAVETLRAYMTRMGAVAGALGHLHRRDPAERPDPGRRTRAMTATVDALAVLFEPEQDRLRRDPEYLARVFHTLVLAGGDATDLVDLFLNGAAVPQNGGQPAPAAAKVQHGHPSPA